MYESDIMLSVQVKSKKDKQELWAFLRRVGEEVRHNYPGVQIILTANDEEDLTPDSTESEVTLTQNVVLNSETIDRIRPIIKKALFEQDAATYHGKSNDTGQLASDTAVEVITELNK